MAAVTFDTLQFVETLKEAGVPEAQAKAFSVAVKNSHETAELATKADLREYESAIRNDLERLDTGLRHEIGDLRKDMVSASESLRKDMSGLEQRIDAKLEKLNLRLIIWLGSIVFAAVNIGPILPKLLHLA